MFGVWGVAPSGWKVVFTGKGRKCPFRDEHSQASGTGKGVQGPSMDLSPKVEAAGLSQDHSQGQAGIREGSSLPTGLLPSTAGASSQGLATPRIQHPLPQPVGRQSGGFSRGLCRVGGFPRARSGAGLSWRSLPQI